jgi:hypothetical protein
VAMGWQLLLQRLLLLLLLLLGQHGVVVLLLLRGLLWLLLVHLLLQVIGLLCLLLLGRVAASAPPAQGGQPPQLLKLRSLRLRLCQCMRLCLVQVGREGGGQAAGAPCAALRLRLQHLELGPALQLPEGRAWALLLLLLLLLLLRSHAGASARGAQHGHVRRGGQGRQGLCTHAAQLKGIPCAAPTAKAPTAKGAATSAQRCQHSVAGERAGGVGLRPAPRSAAAQAPPPGVQVREVEGL